MGLDDRAVREIKVSRAGTSPARRMAISAEVRLAFSRRGSAFVIGAASGVETHELPAVAFRRGLDPAKIHVGTDVQGGAVVAPCTIPCLLTGEQGSEVLAGWGDD